MNETPESDIPRVLPVEGEIPVAIPVQQREPWFRFPWPGWWGGVLTTIGYWLVLAIVMVAVVAVAFVVQELKGGGNNIAAVGGQNLPAVIHFGLTISMLLAYIGGLVYSIVALRLAVGRGWARQIGLGRLPLHSVALALLALPGFICASDIAGSLITELIDAICNAIGIARPMSLQMDLGQQFNPYHWSLVVLIVGVAPGVAEEFWCRGFLGQGFIGRYGTWLGIILTSAIFGFLHLWPPAYVVTTAIMGAALHFTYLTSRSLWVPILIHTLNNSLAGLMELKIINPDPLVNALQQQTLLFGLLSAGLLVFAGYAMWTGRGRIVNAQGEPAAAEHPGVIVPPRMSELSIVHSAPSVLAVLFAAAASGLILYLMFAR